MPAFSTPFATDRRSGEGSPVYTARAPSKFSLERLRPGEIVFSRIRDLFERRYLSHAHCNLRDTLESPKICRSNVFRRSAKFPDSPNSSISADRAASSPCPSRSCTRRARDPPFNLHATIVSPDRPVPLDRRVRARRATENAVSCRQTDCDYPRLMP